jgi:putative transposase
LEDLIEQGIPISRKRVARLMQAEGLKGRVRKRYRSTTMSDHDQPIAANVLDRQFVADRPNQRWVGDTTEFLIGSSAKLYLAAIMDLHSRFIVGWALSAVNDRHLTLSALDKALKRRCPETGLLHHSDQGSTLGFKGPSQRICASLSLDDFEVLLQASSSRVSFVGDC